ncbi:hypothetical protein [Lutibacter oricola]|nr:hypothetical protein [Lutibacter oricola]
MLNKDFGDYEDETLFVPNALMVRNGVDVKLNNRLSAGLNIGLDWHPEISILAVPYFADAKFNIAKNDDDRFYAVAGYGKLLKLGNGFERGNYHKFGLGVEVSSSDKIGFQIGLDFHQKTIANYKNGKLNSLSFGLGVFFL